MSCAACDCAARSSGTSAVATDGIRRCRAALLRVADGRGLGLAGCAARPPRRPRNRPDARAARRALDDRRPEPPGRPVALGAARAFRRVGRAAADAVPDELAHAVRRAPTARRGRHGGDDRPEARLRVRGRLRARLPSSVWWGSPRRCGGAHSACRDKPRGPEVRGAARAQSCRLRASRGSQKATTVGQPRTEPAVRSRRDAPRSARTGRSA